MSINAFQPQGNTYLIAASSSTSGTATQYSTVNANSGVLVTNPSTVTVYVAFGSSTVQSVVPTTSTPNVGIPFPGGTARTFNLSANPTNMWVSAVTSAGTAAPGLFVTGGFGQ